MGWDGADLDSVRPPGSSLVEFLTPAGRESLALQADSSLVDMARDDYQLGRDNILGLIDALLASAEQRLAHVEPVEAMSKAEVAMRAASGKLGIGVD